jgi:predicted nuclease of predicted toxin-antitoxin system
VKLLFDVNLSPTLVQLLADVCPASQHVANCPISTEDDTIWDFAGANDFTVVSKDSDFYRLSTLLGAPPKVIWLRVGNDGTMAIASLLRASLTSLQQFHGDPTTTLLILGRRSNP